MSGRGRIQADVRLVDGWFVEKMGRGVPNPFVASLDELGSFNRAKARLLYDCLGDFGLGAPDPEPWFDVPQYDGRLICATGFGAPDPRWDERTGAFWPGSAAPVWSGLSTVADVQRLPIPNWAENRLIQEQVRKWAEAERAAGPARARQMPLNWTELSWGHPITGASYRLWVYPTFVDLGGFLMDSSEFMIVLARDPELAHSLLSKCFALSVSLADFLRQVYGRPRDEGWGSLGGDNSCLLSPDMYRQYAMTFDALVRQRCGNVPRNLHSCGASRHLYEVWAEYPEREQIVLMQTRALPGKMKPLRQSLPNTYIQLTLHQPQVDFEHETPDRIREIVRQCAEELAFRDMSILVLLSTVDEACRANLAAFYSAIDEVNAEAEQLARPPLPGLQ
jgi:hypothetical protein